MRSYNEEYSKQRNTKKGGLVYMGREKGPEIFEKSKGSQWDWNIMRKNRNDVR